MPHTEQLATLIAEDPHQTTMAMAETLGLTEGALIRLLPAEWVTLWSGDQAEALLLQLSQWGALTTIVESDGSIFEFKGLLPAEVLGAPVTFMTYTATVMNLGILGLDQTLLPVNPGPPAQNAEGQAADQGQHQHPPALLPHGRHIDGPLAALLTLLQILEHLIDHAHGQTP